VQTEKLDIGSASLVHTTYGPGIEDVALEYVEHSPDAWYSDRDVSIDIDADRARQIIEFLAKALRLAVTIGPSPTP